MAVTLSAAQLRAALRLGDSTEESEEAMRLLKYAKVAVTQRAPDAPDEVHNEAVIRLAGYLYDQPTVGREAEYANALRNSGAGAILLPYVQRRATSTGS